MANLLNSSADPLCPTFASGTWSLMNSSSILSNNNDCAAPGQPNGYANTFPNNTVGSFNNSWANDYLTPKVPTYSSGLLSFGSTGLQS